MAPSSLGPSSAPTPASSPSNWSTDHRRDIVAGGLGLTAGVGNADAVGEVAVEGAPRRSPGPPSPPSPPSPPPPLPAMGQKVQETLRPTCGALPAGASPGTLNAVRVRADTQADGRPAVPSEDLLGRLPQPSKAARRPVEASGGACM
mmetsp:Transcript_18946/g.60124  ORF Transcript_18946/g.60124 Transcript_18946/m.60124 type:complete len:147 (-) Transcript_18946:1577-2017(-)